MATSPAYAPRADRIPISIALPISSGALWLTLPVVFSLLLYYFIGVDQGALSVFGNDMHIHEFVHDARHFLGFPCH
jgi:Probable cobalt transporter subunit (CbtB)